MSDRSLSPTTCPLRVFHPVSVTVPTPVPGAAASATHGRIRDLLVPVCPAPRLRDDLDGVADVDVVEVPRGVVRAQIDAAVADVGVALFVDRPRGRGDLHAAPGDP